MINVKVPNFDPVRLRIAQERKNFQKAMFEQLLKWADGEVSEFQSWIFAGNITPPKKVDDGNPTGVVSMIYAQSIAVVLEGDDSLQGVVLDEHGEPSGLDTSLVAEKLDKGWPENNQPARPHFYLLQKRINDGAPAQIKKIADGVFRRIAGR